MDKLGGLLESPLLVEDGCTPQLLCFFGGSPDVGIFRQPNGGLLTAHGTELNLEKARRGCSEGRSPFLTFCSSYLSVCGRPRQPLFRLVIWLSILGIPLLNSFLLLLLLLLLLCSDSPSLSPPLHSAIPSLHLLSSTPPPP